jgi:RHS repeat-associated protein
MKTLTGKTSYAYDLIYQLTGINYASGDAETFSYDAMGNRLSRTYNGETTTYTYNAANEILTAGTVNFSHDLRGNLTAKGEQQMHWNNRNMMNRVVQPGKADVLFEYDAFNRRASQQNENGTTRYVYDGQNLVLELNEQNQPVSYFSYGANGLIGKEDLSANKTIYYLYDGLGNVVNTTDEAGRILQTYEYEAFGRVRNISFDPHNDFRSLGAYGLLQDDATDFRYNRARYYDAEIGRFISRDPIGIAGGINLYGYARNNAVNWVDVDGEAYLKLLFDVSRFFITFMRLAKDMGDAIPPPSPAEPEESQCDKPQGPPTRAVPPPNSEDLPLPAH